MLITMNKNSFIGGGVHGNAGETYEVDSPSYLLAKGFAREATPEEAAAWNKENGNPSKPKEPKAKKDDAKAKKSDKPKEPKAKKEKPVVVKVPFSEVKDKAKALGVPIKGDRATIEAAIAAKEAEPK
jgi:post-segregation antitoxin (ccd killing protein)